MMKIDKNVLRKLCNRERAAIEQWFNSYADAVFTFIYYKVGRDSELARDVVQDTFLEGITKMSQYDSKKASMYVWLTFLSRNHIKKALRDKNKIQLKQDNVESDSKWFDYCRKISSRLIPDEVLQSKETAELVKITLAEIPANHGEILKHRYYNGQSIRQIAAFCQITENAAKVLLHRARKSFEKAFIKLAGESDLISIK